MRKVPALFDMAIRHHRGGRLQEARDAYEKVLQNQPDQVDTLHMLGVLEYQEGNYGAAISLLARVRAQAPDDAGFYINLGNALGACGRLAESVEAFQRAIKINPGLAVAYNNLGNALSKQGEVEQALSAFQKALDIDKGYTEAYVNLATAYQVSGDVAMAARYYQYAIELDPKHVSAGHMLKALQGEHSDAAPQEYVTNLFDDYAANFDHHLVEKLGYTMPGLLRDEIDKLLEPDVRFRNVIDLGCGTGLAGVAFRPVSVRMTGIDLSARMIEKTRARGVYDALRTGDLVAMLQDSDEYYDLFICADVFPYIGDVHPLFSAVSCCAEKKAIFAFSTETGAAHNYKLCATGRYAHSQDYIRSSAAAGGFSVMTMRTHNLRKQNDQWIRGDLVILQYQG